MVAKINIVASDSCPACKSCSNLIERVQIEHPDVMVEFLDATDKHVSRFQKLNLNKPVSSIKDPELRNHYLRAGVRVLNGMPTMYITSSHRPNRILDIMVGCISPNATREQRDNMQVEISNFFYKAKAYDMSFNTSLVAKNSRRSRY